MRIAQKWVMKLNQKIKILKTSYDFSLLLGSEDERLKPYYLQWMHPWSVLQSKRWKLLSAEHASAYTEKKMQDTDEL